MSKPSEYVVLVTGANNGIGFATCCRLIDEFLYTRPASEHIKLIVTTRSESKAKSTIDRLQKHADEWSTKFIRTKPGFFSKVQPGEFPIDKDRVSFQSELLELTDIASIRDCARRLRKTNDKIDAIILNAGISDLDGINWGKATWRCLTDIKYALVWPDFFTHFTGLVAPNQTVKAGPDAFQPPIGKVFMANVFGHYLLSHDLIPLLARAPSQQPARIIWVSSIATWDASFSSDDLQCLRSASSYEGSKRLTDLLALSSTLPLPKPYVSSFLTHPSTPSSRTLAPNLYVTHPGCVITDIVGMTNPIVLFGWWLAFWLARILGSPWHNITPYVGAAAGVWAALAPVEMLDGVEEKRGKGKWGTATNWMGDERVVKSEVDGWGFGGRVGPERKSGYPRRRGARKLTAETRAEFEEDAARAWREMEELRKEWEELIGE